MQLRNWIRRCLGPLVPSFTPSQLHLSSLFGYLYGDLQSLHVFTATCRCNSLEEESLA